MKTLRTFLIIVLATTFHICASAQDIGEVNMFAFFNTAGNSYEYSIPKMLAEKQPKWEPSQKDIPLSIADAVAKTQLWLKNKNPKIDSFTPCNIRLSSVAYGRSTGIWYYNIQFVGVANGKSLSCSELNAVILLDGSIVEPRQGK